VKERGRERWGTPDDGCGNGFRPFDFHSSLSGAPARERERERGSERDRERERAREREGVRE
jgi:hypothetical protein